MPSGPLTHSVTRGIFLNHSAPSVAAWFKPAPTPTFELCFFIFDMARAAVVTTMADVYEKAETPVEMQTFISSVLGLQKLQDFLAYVVRKDYETEWKAIVEGAFPSRLPEKQVKVQKRWSPSRRMTSGSSLQK